MATTRLSIYSGGLMCLKILHSLSVAYPWKCICRMWTLSAIFKIATTGVSEKKFGRLKIVFCYKWPSKYTFRHRYS